MVCWAFACGGYSADASTECCLREAMLGYRRGLQPGRMVLYDF